MFCVLFALPVVFSCLVCVLRFVLASNMFSFVCFFRAVLFCQCARLLYSVLRFFNWVLVVVCRVFMFGLCVVSFYGICFVTIGVR